MKHLTYKIICVIAVMFGAQLTSASDINQYQQNYQDYYGNHSQRYDNLYDRPHYRHLHNHYSNYRAPDYYGRYKRKGKSLKQKTGYDNIVVLSSDGVVDELELLRVADPDRRFLSEEIGLGQDGAEEFTDAAQEYFRDQFGIDFTGLPWMNGTKLIPGVAILEIRNFSPDINYRAIYVNKKRVNYPLDAGGIFMTIIGSDVIYGGRYGGEQGVPAFPFDLAVAGFYKIDRGNHKRPLILRFQQGDSPTHFTFEGFNLFENTIYSSRWGEGISFGAAQAAPDPAIGKFRSVIRNVITFPGTLPDTPLN